MGWDPDLAFLSYGPRFRKHRKLLQSYFTQPAGVKFQPIQQQNALILARGFVENKRTYSQLIGRFSTAIVMSIAYGHQIDSDDDEYLLIAQESGYSLTNGGPPGGTMVDFFPILRHFPSWFPGTYYYKFARERRWSIDDLYNRPYEHVKEQEAQGTAHPSFLLKQLETTAGRTLTDEEIGDIKGSAAVIFGAGAETSRGTEQKLCSDFLPSQIRVNRIGFHTTERVLDHQLHVGPRSEPMYPVIFATLLLALLALASPNANVSVFNPFQALVLKTPPKSGPPICCLKSQKNSDLLDDDVLLLSFEEWKAKQAELQARESGNARIEGRNESGGYNSEDTHSGGSNNETDGVHASPASNYQDWDAGYVEEQSPHFRVPLTDRFNYASLDCSARIHLTHRSAKSASSILSSKRDKYMLSPCREGKQFVIVELCEDIRIDTVQMANYEFFSGVFKDFEVSVAKTYNSDSWVDAGMYRAKNIRGVQSFHPPRSLRDFYRFIRIDFHSHYGNEYYCPISLLRVYGLTHLEQWKWDMWEAESKAKKASPSDRAVEVVAIPKQVQYAEPVVAIVSEKQSATEIASGVSTDALPTSSIASDTILPSMPVNEAPSNSLSFESNSTGTPVTQSTPATNTHENNDHQDTDAPLPHHSTDTYVSSHSITQAATVTPTSDASSQDDDQPPVKKTESSSLSSSTTTPLATPILPPKDSSVNVTSSVVQTTTSATSWSTTTSVFTLVKPTVQSSSTVSVQQAPPPPPPPPPSPPHGSPFAAGNGESIYRVIMNRLMALETNHTLYARYVEDQVGGISEVLKRLSEEVGRLDGIGKGQAQMFSRTVKEWEKYRNRADNQYVELMHRVNYLADEVMLEKRLGIAQLCLLLAVLVFMGLTRGSRMSEGDLQSLLAQRIADRDRRERDRERTIGHTGRLPNAGRVREWGRRHLSSISGDWVNRFARSQSRGSDDTQKLGEAEKENIAPAQMEDSKPGGLVEFPSLSRKIPNHTKRRIGAKPRSRTPSLRTPLSASRYYLSPTHINSGGSPTTHRAANFEVPNGSIMQKAYSQGHMGGIPTAGSWSGVVGREVIPRSSVKRWARSAHLHEVKISRRHGRSRTSSDVRGESQVASKDKGSNQVADRSEEDVDTEGQIDDVFTSPLSSTKGNGYLSALERGPLYGRHAPHSLLVYPGLSLVRRRPASGEGESDWVDTDATESLEGGSEFGSL
ncbi:hypothetical protein EYR40_001465 [Pleurotus pulmonarius]|nr:hypothetical protein EYR40_001465 [Pleurotus pulmonarius]